MQRRFIICLLALALIIVARAEIQYEVLCWYDTPGQTYAYVLTRTKDLKSTHGLTLTFDEEGPHFINMQVRKYDSETGKYGEKGGITRKMFVYKKTNHYEYNGGITRYRYSINGHGKKEVYTDRTYEWVDSLDTHVYSYPKTLFFEVDLQDIELWDAEPGEKEGTYKIEYKLEVCTTSGWQTPETWNFEIEPLSKSAPKLTYDGRYLSMSGAEGQKILYSEGADSDPVENGTEFTAKIDVDGIGKTYRVVAIDSDGKKSQVVDTVINCYGDDTHAEVLHTGLLADSYGWQDYKFKGTEFTVSGPLDYNDIYWIKTQESIQHLDMTDVKDKGFSDSWDWAGKNLKTVLMPKEMSTGTIQVSSTRTQLSSMAWQSTTPLEITGWPNPNMVVYASSANNVSSGTKSKCIVVAEGYAVNPVVLDPKYLFNAMRDFTAPEISYTFDNTNYATPLDGSTSGWTTVALPFDVQSVGHEKGELTPFGVNPEEETLRYWLYSPVSSGWEKAMQIEAYKPYLVAFPNNSGYYEPMNVKGVITYSAKDAVVRATPEIEGYPFRDGMMMYPSFDGAVGHAGALQVNEYKSQDDTYGIHPTGSVFHDSDFTPNSFECYIIAQPGTRCVPIMNHSVVGTLAGDLGIEVWCEGNAVCVRAAFSTAMPVYDLTGRVAATLRTVPGEVVRADGLAAGIYIVNKMKIAVK